MKNAVSYQRDFEIAIEKATATAGMPYGNFVPTLSKFLLHLVDGSGRGAGGFGRIWKSGCREPDRCAVIH
jgi:hypothetical protein